MFVQILLFSFSIYLLAVHLRTKKKKHFLLSVIPIILASILTYIDISSNTALIFLLAITFSFLGDLLMAEKLSITSNRIVNGTIGFGIAHVFYIIGFWQIGNGEINFFHLLFGFIMATILFYLVAYNPVSKKEILIATYLYSIIIGILFVTILIFVSSEGNWNAKGLVPLVGIILFIISDSIISRNAFKQKFQNAQEWIAVTYIPAQILLQSTLLMI